MELKGRKVNFLGDSITEGSGVTDIANCRFDNRLAAMCGLTAKNYGIGGTRLAHQPQPSENPRYDLCFCGRAYNMDRTADMVIVYGGVNDYIHGNAPFGQLGDTTPATYCGGVYFLMNYLKTTYGDKPVVFLTPARCFLRHEVSDLAPSTHAAKTTPGKELLAYVEVIQKTAQQFGIPVLDLYHDLGVDPHIPEQFAAYTTDGLHLNDAGHGLLADKLKAFLEAL
jgi:lysophospholipase L1-like esterase